MKVLLDEIFGKENFRNEIIINRTQEFFKHATGLKKFMVDTDSVYFYTKASEYLFNEIKILRQDEKWWEITLPGKPKNEEDKYRTISWKAI